MPSVQSQGLMDRIVVDLWRKRMVQVEIRVKRRIDRRWSEWLDDLNITYTGRGETVLSGTVADQSALYGLVAKLRDLGLPLSSVSALEEGDQETPGSRPAA